MITKQSLIVYFILGITFLAPSTVFAFDGLNYGHITGTSFVFDTVSGTYGSGYWAVYNNNPFATTTEVLGGSPVSFTVGSSIGLSGLGITAGDRWIGFYTGNPPSVSNNLVSWYYFSYDGVSYTTDSFSTNTRIDLVSPYDGQSVSSTTPITLEVSGYVNVNDAVEGVGLDSPVQIKWNVSSLSQSAQGMSVLDAFNNATGQGAGSLSFYSGYSSVDWGSQIFNLSTTTGDPLPIGWYKMTTSLVRPNTILGFSNFFGLSFGEEVLVATSTDFLVATSSSIDLLINQIQGSIAGTNPYQGSGIFSASSTEQILAGCDIPFDFSLSGCLAVLFLPNFIQLGEIFGQLKDGLGSAVPWGYVTRALVIMTGNATTTLPSLVIDFSDSPPDTAFISTGAVLDLTPWSDLMGTTSLLGSATSTGSGETFRQITETGWNIFVLLTFAFLVIHDILGVKGSMQPEHKKTEV